MPLPLTSTRKTCASMTSNSLVPAKLDDSTFRLGVLIIPERQPLSQASKATITMRKANLAEEAAESGHPPTFLVNPTSGINYQSATLVVLLVDCLFQTSERNCNMRPLAVNLLQQKLPLSTLKPSLNHLKFCSCLVLPPPMPQDFHCRCLRHHHHLLGMQ